MKKMIKVKTLIIWVTTVATGTLVSIITSPSGAPFEMVLQTFVLASVFTLPALPILWSGIRLMISMADSLERITVLFTTLFIVNAIPILLIISIHNGWNNHFARNFIENVYDLKGYIIVSLPISFMICRKMLDTHNDRFLMADTEIDVFQKKQGNN